MKKRIEAEIQSLATDLLNKKDSRSTQEWKNITMQLYDKLCVLDYLEKQLHVSSVEKDNTEPQKIVEPIVNEQPSIMNYDTIENTQEEVKKTESQFTVKEKTKPEQTEEVVQPTIKEKTAENEIQQTINPDPAIEKIETKAPKAQEPAKRVADELKRFASTYKQTPVFGRKQADKEPIKNTYNAQANKPRSLNESLNKGLHIGLNDRIAFINNLFAGSTQDFNRVLSQINTMDDFDSIQLFLEQQIKPDYQNWAGKEEFSERFLAIIEKKFS